MYFSAFIFPVIVGFRANRCGAYLVGTVMAALRKPIIIPVIVGFRVNPRGTYLVGIVIA